MAAEHNYKFGKNLGVATAGVGVGVGVGAKLFAGGAGASATGAGAVAGVPMMIMGGLLLLGTAIFGVSSAMENAAVKTEAYNAAVEKAKKYSKNMEQN